MKANKTLGEIELIEWAEKQIFYKDFTRPALGLPLRPYFLECIRAFYLRLKGRKN